MLSLLLVSIAGCDGCDEMAEPDDLVDFEPTGTQILSVGSPTKDEDPSVLRARDGSMFLAWFSDRGGNNDIYITRTRDGREWSEPVRVTTSTDGDFAPSLIQDATGMFHLVWFRWFALNRGNIWYNSSADGLTWDRNREVQITHGVGVDDWIPSVTRTADGSLLVFFVSQARWPSDTPTRDLYVAIKRPTSGTWDAPVGVHRANSPVEHDHLPFAARTGDSITLVWVRHDRSQPDPWLSPPPKSDLFYASSANGTVFTDPRRITTDSGLVVNVFPGLYQKHGGGWSVNWLSTREGSPRVFELPLADADRYPEGLAQIDPLPPGYSHRIAASPRAGVYLGAWVQGPDGAQDIYYRFFNR